VKLVLKTNPRSLHYVQPDARTRTNITKSMSAMFEELSGMKVSKTQPISLDNNDKEFEQAK
jgi:hypothetical protein